MQSRDRRAKARRWSLALSGGSNRSLHGVGDGLIEGDEGFRALLVSSDFVYELVEIR